MTKLYKPPTTNNKKFSLENPEDKKPTGRAKGYDSVWEKYRWRFLHYNNQCYACGAKARVVDHIVAHKGDSDLFKDLTNHMPLCNSCHSIVTGRFDRHQTPKTEKKMQWIETSRKMFNVKISIHVLTIYDKTKKKRPHHQ